MAFRQGLEPLGSQLPLALDLIIFCCYSFPQGKIAIHICASLLLQFKKHSDIVVLLALHIQGGEMVAKSKTPAKRARIAEDNRLRNKAQKSKLKTSIKTYEASLTGDNVDAARENLIKVTSLIDKSVTKGVLHKNTAARKKSALAKKFNSLAGN
jgi:small subunit ribosomal protein S20